MSDDPPNPALLPAGLRDLLPPEAETEASAIDVVMDAFASHGYQRVKPPLMEYEDGLLTGTGTGLSDQIFRLMDPATHRMIGIRADITPQVARIATTRLAHAPRPLRLSYSGQVLRVSGAGPVPDRQISQAGIELIGHDSPEADAEVVLVAAEALAALGLVHVSFDLTMPPLVQSLLEEATPEHRPALARALDRKDAASVAEHGGALAGTLTELLLSAGPAERALSVLAKVKLPPTARAHAARLADVVGAIRARAPTLKLTLDPVEFRGYRYHSGVCSEVYFPGHPEALGRGGRYACGDGEPATGITLFPDAVLRAAPARSARARVFLPFGTDMAEGAELRMNGWATVAGLEPQADDATAARTQGCGHLWDGGVLIEMGE